MTKLTLLHTSSGAAVNARNFGRTQTRHKRYLYQMGLYGSRLKTVVRLDAMHASSVQGDHVEVHDYTNFVE